MTLREKGYDMDRQDGLDTEGVMFQIAGKNLTTVQNEYNQMEQMIKERLEQTGHAGITEEEAQRLRNLSEDLKKAEKLLKEMVEKYRPLDSN